MGSIYDDPPDVNVVINGWRKGKNKKIAYYVNPPPVFETADLDQKLLSDYIEYLSKGLKFIQYNNEVNRRSELRYCSYLDKAVELYRKETQFATSGSEILNVFLSESLDSSSVKDRIYLFKKNGWKTFKQNDYTMPIELACNRLR